MFSTHTGVLARTLVGHESGVWGVCLVGKGGWREGGEGVKEGGRGSSNERREMKERKKQKQRERQSEREDRETTPRPSKESASVTLVVDPDSKKPRRRKDTEKGKEKDGQKAEERKSRRATTPNEPPIVGHLRVEANDRVREEPPRGSSSSSHHEMRPGPSSATTAATPASAGTSKTRRASTSPTTPKRPRKYPSTIPHGLQDQADEFQDLSILHPVESGLAGKTFPILSAGVGASSAPATASASTIVDESEEPHGKSRHDTHHHHHQPHHHPQHPRRSRRNSIVNQGGTSITSRNNDPSHRRAEHVEHVEPNANPHAHQRGSVPKGDGMHVMPGESLAHLLPAALRVSLGLPAVATGSDASGASSDSEEDEVAVGEAGQSGYRRRRGDSHRQQGEEEGASGDFQDGGERKPLGYDGKQEEGNMTNASRGWGQPNALVVSGGCDKVLRVWEVKSGLVLFIFGLVF